MKGVIQIKSIKLFLILVLVAMVVMVSGCTNSNNSNKVYNVTLSTPTDFATYNEQKAFDYVKPTESDVGFGFQVTDYGIKAINGITVYYNVYKDTTDNSVNGEIVFKKNNAWNLINWEDITNNPNKDAINKEISNKINSA